ncbi:hypothetical protein NPIL_40091 [Nephila pilipes]|uniref:Uncharacterized protein n=1 Tax=Nephila pilipes TaxID=299642 RepID=A0A8X6PYR4_NEPPI|nr:hypothetical protein NPIL_40091 [Nephila pilipes]
MYSSARVSSVSEVTGRIQRFGFQFQMRKLYSPFSENIWRKFSNYLTIKLRPRNPHSQPLSRLKAKINSEESTKSFPLRLLSETLIQLEKTVPVNVFALQHVQPNPPTFPRPNMILGCRKAEISMAPKCRQS